MAVAGVVADEDEDECELLPLIQAGNCAAEHQEEGERDEVG